MRRRNLLATLGGLGVVGSGVAVFRRRDDDAVSPVRIETLDAPGSDAGERRVPEPGAVTVLEFFATWCSTCATYMETLGTVHDAVDAEFVSVTNEPVGVSVERSDVVDWWRTHDGAWTVGLDSELELTTSLDASAVPYTVVFDAANEVVYADAGVRSESELIDVIESVSARP